MKNSSNQIDRKILKTLEPLNQLNPILLDELAAKSIIDEVPAGRIICRHGEKDSRQIYLLSGQIEVATPGETKIKVIKSKSALKTPVAQGSTQHVATLKTKTESTLLYIDADLLELLLSDGPELNSTYEVTEIGVDEDADDWMLTFLQSPAFLQLPTENIQKLLTHMDEIHVKKDQVVIKQDGKDDNYYIIKSGSCNVHRKPHKDAANVLLAVLPTGSGFGEEALITNGSRNATITMRENGTLMRLKKDDFLNLLISPLIPYFEHSETKNKIEQGSVVIDVRSEKDSKQNAIDGAVNIPLSMLRVKFDSLNTDREYLLVCNDGSQSAAAAFLMIQSGLKCSVLKGGINSSKSGSTSTVKSSSTTNKPAPAKAAETNTAAKATKQNEQIAAQQKQIKEARLKAEQDIIKHKKELAESRARIAQKNKQLSSVQNETTQLKEKAAKELAKAQTESKAIELRQKEANQAMQHAEKMMKQSAAAAEQARQAAEKEAAAIKQRAIEEAEYLRAEVEAARQKMEQDAARIKEEEKIIKTSALKIKNEADEIRRAAMNDAQQVKAEIESTRTLLNKKLQQTQDEEKRKHDAILAEAKKRADLLAATKTQQAAEEAEEIRRQAKLDAAKLHDQLENTRKQIEAEAAQVITKLKEQSRQSEEQKVTEIKEEVLVEVVAEEDVDYKSVSIPGMASSVDHIGDAAAKRKAEAIKARLSQSQVNNAVQQSNNLDLSASEVKVHTNNDKTILEGEDDLFIFKAPGTSIKTELPDVDSAPVVSQRTKSESVLTQISIKPQESIVIHPQQEQESAYKNNPFLNKEKAQTTGMSYSQQASVGNSDFVIPKNAQQFNKEAYMQKHHANKSNTLAIAASFVMILAGAIFTLHATNTLKVQSIAALFNSGNDNIQTTTAIAKTKTIRKKVLRADTKVNVKKKVGNKMDDIMQGWKEVLSEAENPKKSKK